MARNDGLRDVYVEYVSYTVLQHLPAAAYGDEITEAGVKAGRIFLTGIISRHNHSERCILIRFRNDRKYWLMIRTARMSRSLESFLGCNAIVVTNIMPNHELTLERFWNKMAVRAAGSDQCLMDAERLLIETFDLLQCTPLVRTELLSCLQTTDYFPLESSSPPKSKLPEIELARDGHIQQVAKLAVSCDPLCGNLLFKSKWNQWLEDGDATVIVAKADSKVIGYIVCVQDPDHIDKSGLIISMAVDQQFRRQKIATRMLNQLLGIQETKVCTVVPDCYLEALPFFKAYGSHSRMWKPYDFSSDAIRDAAFTIKQDLYRFRIEPKTTRSASDAIDGSIGVLVNKQKGNS